MFDPTQVNKIHIRHSDFFGNSSKFKQFTEDLDKTKINDITDVEIQCLGYGHFNKPKVLSNFFSYLRALINFCKNIKILKIQLHGFQLPQQKIIPKICTDIIKNIKQSIKILWFHTGQLTNCQIQDFQSMLSLTTQLSNVNFQDISLQLSRWNFQRSQPNISEIEEIFSRVLKNAEMTKINNHRFRLQLSAWYYDYFSAKSFLKFKCQQNEILKSFGIKNRQQLDNKKTQNKEFAERLTILQNGDFFEESLLPVKIQQFHKKIQNLIRNLLEMMDHVKEFQIDFRNWNDLLKMKDLKKKLDNITKKDTYEKSIVSKKIALDSNMNEIQLKMVFVI